MRKRLIFSLGMCVLSVGFAQALPPLDTIRGFSTGEQNGRSYAPPPSFWQLSPRTLIAPAPTRDPALMKVQPGDKVNKLPEAEGNRYLSPPDAGRLLVPALPTHANPRIVGEPRKPQ